MTFQDEVKFQEHEQRIAELESLTNRWKNLGASDMFGGYGFQSFGSGYMRASNLGIQMLADDAYTGIYWVSQFNYGTAAGEDPAGALTAPFAYIIDRSNPDTGVSQLVLLSRGEQVGNQAVIGLYGGDGSSAIATQNGTSVGPFIGLEALLELYSATSDPASNKLADAMAWYRSDIDKFRGRANGATDNFAMEGWVASSLTAPWVVASESSGPYSAAAGEFVLANGTFTVNLPENAASGSVIAVKNVGAGTITVSRSGADTIDGATSMSLTTQYEAYNYVSDGADWWVY